MVGSKTFFFHPDIVQPKYQALSELEPQAFEPPDLEPPALEPQRL